MAHNKCDLDVCIGNIDVCFLGMKGQAMKISDISSDQTINLTYRKMKEEDIKALVPIMKAAFDEDTRMHTDLEEDGPFGYDDGSLLESELAHRNTDSYVIFVNDHIAGGYCVIDMERTCTLDLLFLNPAYCSLGIGSRVWKHIEESYPDCDTWLVETPDYSTRNHHFYEKCGFRKDHVNTYDDSSKSFCFIKEMRMQQR